MVIEHYSQIKLNKLYYSWFNAHPTKSVYIIFRKFENETYVFNAEVYDDNNGKYNTLVPIEAITKGQLTEVVNDKLKLKLALKGLTE